MKNKLTLHFIYIILVTFFFPSLSYAGKISSIRAQSVGNQWEISISSNVPLQYASFNLNHPERLVIDIANAYYQNKLYQQTVTRAPFKTFRIARRNAQGARLVFDLLQPVAVKSHALKLAGNSRYVLILYFSAKSNSLPIYENKIEPTATTKSKATELSSEIPKMPAMDETSPALSASQKDIVIVIDPGHGGKDPGAIGSHGTEEKTVVLSIAKTLQTEINHHPGFKAILTRNGNYYIPLRTRLDIARRFHADMFISIHADAYRNRQARGISVYALSHRGATSEAARWLAERENSSELMGGVDLSDKDAMLRSVLISLSQTATTRSSLIIAQKLLAHLRSTLPMHHNRVEQAAFVVLKSPDIPSLLIETGYLSNPFEESKLKSYEYQDLVAKMLTRGIVQYFGEHFSRNTALNNEELKTENL